MSAAVRDQGIPVKLNLLIALIALSTSVFLLWVAGASSNWMIVGVAAFAFSFSNNTVFSLLHECVHGSFHPNRRINDGAGVLFAALFPTAFAIQRISHFGHHRRNRTDQELYDYVLPHQSWWLKTYWIYCLLTGFYWAIIPFACLVYLVCPVAFRSGWFQSGPARLWGFEPFVKDIAAQPVSRVWGQTAFTMAFQVTLFMALDLSVMSWLVCYWAFGINWSSLQYTDHAWSPRDVHEGAWNLRFWPITQYIFLNYNLHLAHHRDPQIPWLHLPAHIRAEDPNPSFWKIYLPLWFGAKAAPPGPSPLPLPRSDAAGSSQFDFRPDPEKEIAR